VSAGSNLTGCVFRWLFDAGGGVGLSVHGGFRVATERTVFAMPETAIGFFPDVGGSHFLPRLDGEFGTYLALTGARLKGADVLFAGIATHYVASSDIPALTEALGALTTFDNAAIAATIDKFAADPGTPSDVFTTHRATIDKCFAFDSCGEIVESLSEDGSEFAEKTKKVCAP